MPRPKLEAGLLPALLLLQIIGGSLTAIPTAEAADRYTYLKYSIQLNLSVKVDYTTPFSRIHTYYAFTTAFTLPTLILDRIRNNAGDIEGRGTAHGEFTLTDSGSFSGSCPSPVSGTYDYDIYGYTSNQTGVNLKPWTNKLDKVVWSGPSGCNGIISNSLMLFDLKSILNDCFGVQSFDIQLTNRGCHIFPIKGGTQAVMLGANPQIYQSITGTAQLTLVNFTIARTTTITSVACSPSSTTRGSPITCTATITGSSGSTPTGSVDWSASSDGRFSSSTCSLSSGKCSVDFTPSSGGDITITATYSGDSNHDASSGKTIIKVTVTDCHEPRFAVQLVGVRTTPSVTTYVNTIQDIDTFFMDGKFFQTATPIDPPECRYSLDVRVTVTVTGADGIPFQYNAPVLSSLGTQPIPDLPTTWVTLAPPSPPTRRPLGIWQAVARADVTLANADPRSDLYGIRKYGPYFSNLLPFIVQSEVPTGTVRLFLGTLLPDATWVTSNVGAGTIQTYGSIVGDIQGTLVFLPETGLPTLRFEVSGATGTTGHMTLVIPKALVGFGLSPVIIVNGIRFPFGGPNACPGLTAPPLPCTTAAFWQDATTYYVRINTVFRSTAAVEVEFSPPSFTSGQSASLVLGQDGFATSVSATGPTGLNRPGGPIFDSFGSLWIVDAGNNRILQFKPPFSNHMSASLVLGQSSFTTSGPSSSENGLNVPAAIAFDLSGNLWVSELVNNRVLEFKTPFTNGMSASLVIGTWLVRGLNTPTQSSLLSPFGLTFDSSGNLWVADSGHSRVLMFAPQFSSGMAPSLVIGQPDFTTYDSTTTQNGLYFANGVAFDSSGNLWVADLVNNRTMQFIPPFKSGMAASLVIGQSSFTTSDCVASQSTVCAPVGVSSDSKGNLWVTDALNSRILGFAPPFASGMNASWVIGQPDFISSAGATSASKILLFLSQQGFVGLTNVAFDTSGNLWVGDSLNNRVLEFTRDIVAPTVMLTFPSEFEQHRFNVGILSNSSISQFEFSQEKKQLTFRGGGRSGTSGYAEVAIPIQLLGGQLTVRVDGQSQPFMESSNSTHTLITVKYPHTSRIITITGTIVIPEFPLSPVMVFVISFALLAILVRRARHGWVRVKPI